MRRGLLLPPNSGRKILTPTQVRTTGRSGQIRQGRQLVNADFTDQGLSVPRALWNLGGLTDASGNAVTLTNGGSVTFGSGITGATTEAALFSRNGSTGFLTAPNSIKQRFGTWGCWFRATPTADASPQGQILMSMFRTAADFAFEFGIQSNKELYVNVSTDGTSANFSSAVAYGCPVLDDVWHFAGFTWDGYKILIYLDGFPVAQTSATTGTYPRGPMYTGGTGLLYLGAHQLDTATPYSGRMDEAFVSPDILKPHHWDYLRAVKIPHGQSAPRFIRARRYHYDKTAVMAASDFSSQPLVGYNFNTGALTTDNYGSLGKTLTNNGSIQEGPSPDGSTGSAVLVAASNQYFSASDASLPSGAASRTIGWMMRRRLGSGFETTFMYGTLAGATQEIRLDHDSAGRMRFVSGAVAECQPLAAADDTYWSWYHLVYDNSHPGGVKAKLYTNGTCQGVSQSTMATVLAGANAFRIGENTDGSANADMMLSNFFICNYAMQPDEIRRQIDKQGDLIGISEIPTEDFLVDIDNTHAYVIFTGVSPRDSIELTVEV